MINTEHLRKNVIVPALTSLRLWSEEAEELVFNTGLVESGYKHIAQLGDGPACSFWQVEPFTAHDLRRNYLQKPQMDAINLRLIWMEVITQDVEWNLMNNMAYAVAMCRLVYRRSPMALPGVDDIQGQARIWKTAYNTSLGKGTEDYFIGKVKSFRAMNEA